MSLSKRAVREQFRDAVFKRDHYQCRVCSWKENLVQLDAHHITDRNDMPNGGYVKENGIALCPDCHKQAEDHFAIGAFIQGLDPNDLYYLIGSSHKLAVEASKRLKR